MKKYLFLLIFISSALTGIAQTPIYFSQELKKAKLERLASSLDGNIAYPIRGACKISEGDMNYKTVELWVYDANENEIYHSFHSVASNELYKNLVIALMFDHDYKAYMMRHGYVLTNRRHKEPALEHQLELSIK